MHHVIRPAVAEDWPALWALLAPVFRAGTTYAIDPAIDEAAARAYWLSSPLACHVAVDAADRPLGSYFLKANLPGPGAHVANAGYVVAEAARGQGIAGALCRHSQAEARAHGFVAMQFNCVVATNTGALRLWQRHGFAIVGTVPRAFAHPAAGHVDAHVMHKTLDDTP